MDKKARLLRLFGALFFGCLGVVDAWYSIFDSEEGVRFLFSQGHIYLPFLPEELLHEYPLQFLSTVAGLSLGASLRFYWGVTHPEVMAQITANNRQDLIVDFTPSFFDRSFGALKNFFYGGVLAMIFYVAIWTAASFVWRGLPEQVALSPVNFPTLLCGIWMGAWLYVGYGSTGALLDSYINIAGLESGFMVANNGRPFDLRNVRSWKIRGFINPKAGNYRYYATGGGFQLAFYAIATWVYEILYKLFCKILQFFKGKGVELILVEGKKNRRVWVVFPDFEKTHNFNDFLKKTLGVAE